MFHQPFNLKIAKRHGIDCALVLSYLQELSSASFITTGKTQISCTDTLLLTKFPWLNTTAVQKVRQRLIDEGYVVVEETDSTLITPVDEHNKVRKPRLKAAVSAYDKVMVLVKPDGEEVEMKVDELIDMLIGEFEKVTPNANLYYNSKAERAAAYTVFEKYGPQMIFDIVKMLPSTNVLQFAPVILSPRDLHHKLPKLLLFLERHRNDGVGMSY